MSQPAFQVEELKENPAFTIAEGVSEEALDSRVFDGSKASNMDVDTRQLARIDELFGQLTDNIPVPEESKLSADLPEDKKLSGLIKDEIDHNRTVQGKKTETLTNILGAAFLSLLRSKPKAADTNIGKLLRNNQNAVIKANAINAAVFRHQKTDAHFNRVLDDLGIEKTPDAIEKAVNENPKVKNAFEMSQAARAELMNQIISPDAQSSIKTMKESRMIGEQSEAHLDNAIKRAANELEKDSTSKLSMENLNKKMSEMMGNISEMIDSLLERFTSSVTPS